MYTWDAAQRVEGFFSIFSIFEFGTSARDSKSVSGESAMRFKQLAWVGFSGVGFGRIGRTGETAPPPYASRFMEISTTITTTTTFSLQTAHAVR